MGTFLLVRHAQSTWNALGRWQGHADPPLSETGEQQTVVAATRVDPTHFDLVVTSGLTRAHETARLLCAQLGVTAAVVVEPLLREFDVGEWSGLNRVEIEQRWPDLLARFDSGDLDHPPGGESRQAFDRRVGEAARAVAGLARAKRAQRVLAVSHGGVIRSLARTSGLDEPRVTHLAGYSGRIGEETLTPLEYVDLLAE